MSIAALHDLAAKCSQQADEAQGEDAFVDLLTIGAIAAVGAAICERLEAIQAALEGRE